MATTQITDTVETITLEDAQNAYAWARKNLSKARYQAFDRQMSELGRNKTSAEYRAAWKVTQEIESAHLRAKADEVQAIYDQANQATAEIDKQIAELHAQKKQIADEMSDRVTRLRIAVYATEEYKAADAKRMEEGKKDLEIFLPKVQKLMQKFLDRQMAAITNEAIEENNR